MQTVQQKVHCAVVRDVQIILITTFQCTLRCDCGNDPQHAYSIRRLYSMISFRKLAVLMGNSPPGVQNQVTKQLNMYYVKVVHVHGLNPEVGWTTHCLSLSLLFMLFKVELIFVSFLTYINVLMVFQSLPGVLSILSINNLSFTVNPCYSFHKVNIIVKL